MATSAHTTNACPRLRNDAPRFTTDEVLAILGDTPARKRKGTLRAIIVRNIPKLSGADLGLSHAIA